MRPAFHRAYRLGIFVGVFLFLVLISSAWAQVSKCGPANCRNLCLQYQTERMNIGESQLYTVVGGMQPFKPYFAQNGGLVKVEWINPRSFRVTALATTERYGVGPVQFSVDEGGGYKCASGSALIYISKTVVSQPPSANPPAVNPPPSTPQQ